MDTYLEWLTRETKTRWWHDSALPAEIDEALKMGALGVTTNPVLTYQTLEAVPEFWEADVREIPQSLCPEARAEALLKIVATYAAQKLLPIYGRTNGEHGYAFGQVNPVHCGNAKQMLEQGLRYASWGPNVAVKLPTTQAALGVIEELAAHGVPLCTTLNFSVSQAVAAALAYERGKSRARQKGIPPRPCYVVQQGGRLDEYLMECGQNDTVSITPEEMSNAGNAVTKRTYRLFEEKGYQARIMPAGLRGVHHLTSMAGGYVVFSLQSRVQKLVNAENPPRMEHIEEDVDPLVIEKLMMLPEFVRAYDVNGLDPSEFITFGVTQKTLSQFLWSGWAPLETYGTSASTARWF